MLDTDCRFGDVDVIESAEIDDADLEWLRMQGLIDGLAESESVIALQIPDSTSGPELSVIACKAYGNLLIRYTQGIVRDRSEAENIVGDIYVELTRKEHPLRNNSRLRSWLFTSATRRAMSYWRHQRVVEKYAVTVSAAMEDETSEQALAHAEQADVVSAVRNLPERQREAIVLRYWAGFSEAEIAAAMKISRGAVKSHTARAMLALRAAFAEE